MTITGWSGQASLTVEAAFAVGVTGTGVWGVSTWDTDKWGPDVTYADISEYVRAVDTKLGKSRESEHYSAGTATIVLDNRDARFSPQNLSGPYVSGGLTGVRPWRPIRVVASSSLAVGIPEDSLTVFAGYIESLSEQFPGTVDATVTLECVDEIAKIAAFNGFEQSAVGAGELAGPRIHRILNNAGNSAPRNIDVGNATMQATTLARNAWAEVLLTADSDGGAVWADPKHGIVYETSSALFQNTRSNTVQARFGESPYLRCRNVAFDYSGDELVNVAALAAAGSTEQRAADQTSRSLYGDHQFSRDDLICQLDAQVLSLATQMVATRAEPELRIAAFTIDPQSDPDLWAQVIERRIRDRIRVTVDHPSGATTVDRECFVEGIEHKITPDFWSVTYRTSSATAYAGAAQFGVWDASVWDVNAFAY